MARDTRPRQRMKEAIESTQKIMSSKDDLIYEFNIVGTRDDFGADEDITIKMLKALGGGRNSVRGSVEITAFNATWPDDILSISDAAYLGKEYGASVETHRNGGNPAIEVFFEFEY